MKIQSSVPLRDRIRETTTVAILDAAEEVVAEGGLAAVSLQAIAERAGVAVGTLYNYFEDKQGLLEALFARRHEDLLQAVDAATKASARASFRDQLEAFVRSVLQHFEANRPFLRVTLQSDQRPAFTKSPDGKTRPVMQELYDRAERVIRLGIKEKELREDASRLFAIVLVSTLRGVLIMKIDDDEPLEAGSQAVIDLFLRGAGR